MARTVPQLRHSNNLSNPKPVHALSRTTQGLIRAEFVKGKGHEDGPRPQIINGSKQDLGARSGPPGLLLRRSERVKGQVIRPTVRKSRILAERNPQRGDFVRIYWPDDNAYYRGMLFTRVIFQSRVFLVFYDDGENEIVDLDMEKWRFDSI